ncbi:hypothetical protein [Yinghuangia soli]|uniref:Glycoside hydrolase family 15 n=1 Tax=Yinghuangia soli TaxID=2908204 RepID=A0AA41TZN9_9ACTN|nr:hypothetical protein [Yinghuangia soli]MCF2529018.1 hypothetical protein [Yinghuangia soli]
MRRGARWVAITAASAVLCGGIAIAAADSPAGKPVPRLLQGGVAADPAAPGGRRSLPGDADPGQPDAAEAAWLAAGRIPGGAAYRGMAERALLDLRLLTSPDGTVAAAWHPVWDYMWPRDAAWVAAAYTATGHGADALAVLRRLAALQNADGTWEARYRLDGGHVGDGRTAQLDGSGWVPWAVWFWYAYQAPADPAAAAALDELWPAVAAAADRAAGSLRGNGLPPAGPDYWETRTDQVTLGTAAPLLAGLRGAADLAAKRGDSAAAQRWSQAADRLAAGVRGTFGPHGYPRTPTARSGADTAVTWLGPPFAAPAADVTAAVRDAEQELTLPNGGILPGGDWRGRKDVAWTPETASFALFDAASGAREAADRRLAWLDRHRTGYGSLPEKVDAEGRPASVAPLAWTAATVVLALAAQETPLPVLPG